MAKKRHSAPGDIPLSVNWTARAFRKGRKGRYEIRYKGRYVGLVDFSKTPTDKKLTRLVDSDGKFLRERFDEAVTLLRRAIQEQKRQSKNHVLTGMVNVSV